MFKRISFIFLLFILISNIGYSQGWAKKAGGTSSDYVVMALPQTAQVIAW